MQQLTLDTASFLIDLLSYSALIMATCRFILSLSLSPSLAQLGLQVSYKFDPHLVFVLSFLSLSVRTCCALKCSAPYVLLHFSCQWCTLLASPGECPLVFVVLLVCCRSTDKLPARVQPFPILPRTTLPIEFDHVLFLAVWRAKTHIHYLTH